MKVFKVKPRGYCKGVVRAIQIAKQTARDYPDQDIYILGMLVHNQYIVDALEALNVKTIDQKGATRLELLDLIDHGVVIITAHGAGDEVSIKAKEKGLIVVDASCKDVIKTHDLIKENIANHKEILYIGKKGHPEAEGALMISDHVHLIENIEDVKQYEQSDKEYMITNQTTMSLYDVKSICDYAKESLLHVEILKETCNATTARQTAMQELPDDLDIFYVIGDPRSNNSNKLKEIATKFSHAKVEMIESVQDININTLMDKKHAGITAGASTPTYLTNQVINYLEQFNPQDPSTYPLPEIDLQQILN